MFYLYSEGLHLKFLKKTDQKYSAELRFLTTQLFPALKSKYCETKSNTWLDSYSGLCTLSLFGKSDLPDAVWQFALCTGPWNCLMTSQSSKAGGSRNENPTEQPFFRKGSAIPSAVHRPSDYSNSSLSKMDYHGELKCLGRTI